MLPNQYYLYYPETGEKFTLDKWEAYNLLTKYNLVHQKFYQHEYDEHNNYFINLVYAIKSTDYCIVIRFDDVKNLFNLLLDLPENTFNYKTANIKTWNQYYNNLLKNHKCEDYLIEYDWHKNNIIYKCEICDKQYEYDDYELYDDEY